MHESQKANWGNVRDIAVTENGYERLVAVSVDKGRLSVFVAPCAVCACVFSANVLFVVCAAGVLLCVLLPPRMASSGVCSLSVRLSYVCVCVCVCLV